MKSKQPSPFLIQRQMMQAIKRLSPTYKRALAEAQIKLVNDSQSMTILEFKNKYLEDDK